MTFSVEFSEQDGSFDARFGEVHNISDGGFERGYAEGDEVGNAEGYTQGFTDASPELWNNDCMAMADSWIKDNSGAYPYRNMGLPSGKYRFSVQEHLACSQSQPPDVRGIYCLYIGTIKATSAGFLFANSSTTTNDKQYEFTVQDGETWYFNIFPQNGQDVLFNRLLLGASLKRIGDV